MNTIKKAIRSLWLRVWGTSEAELLQDYIDELGEDLGLETYRKEGGAL